MFLFFYDKDAYQKFNHDLAIKITTDKLLSSFTFGDKLAKDKSYTKLMNDYLKYNILMSCLLSLQGHFVVTDMTPFEFVSNLEKIEGSSVLIEKMLNFKFPINYKVYMVDYPLELQDVIKQYLKKIPNGDKFDCLFVTNEIMNNIFSNIKNK